MNLNKHILAFDLDDTLSESCFVGNERSREIVKSIILHANATNIPIYIVTSRSNVHDKKLRNRVSPTWHEESLYYGMDPDLIDLILYNIEYVHRDEDPNVPGRWFNWITKAEVSSAQCREKEFGHKELYGRDLFTGHLKMIQIQRILNNNPYGSTLHFFDDAVHNLNAFNYWKDHTIDSRFRDSVRFIGGKGHCVFWDHAAFSC